MYMTGCSMDVTAFRSDIYYVATVQGLEEFKWIYLILGLILPLLIGMMTDRLKRIKK